VNNIYPKFDQKISDHITSSRMQEQKTRAGTVTSYDRISHTVTVVLESHSSNMIGNIVDNIPCPSFYRNSNGCSGTRGQMHNRL
jgi:hypothetical protein